MKIEIIKALGFMLVGAFIWAQFQPEPKTEIIAKQEQAQKCKAVITKKTNKDGSVDEVTEFLAEHWSSQKVERKDSKVERKNALFVGIGTNKKGTLDLNLDKYSHQIVTDGNKDHVYYFKYKVLEF